MMASKFTCFEHLVTSSSNAHTKRIKSALHTPSISLPKHHHAATTVATVPQWNPFQKVAATAFDALQSVLVSLERDHCPLSKTSDPKVQIAGNFGPVPERPATRDLEVVGQLPDCVWGGVYVRNGANRFHRPTVGHHFFDGDGMIHAVKFHSDASASYSCRFTETSRLRQERVLGRPIFPKAIGELHGHSGVARLALVLSRLAFGLLDSSEGLGVANVGVVYFNGRLLAMSEDDLPYHVRVTPSGDLKTEGRFDFDGKLESSMIAHPKIDPTSGELFGLTYDVIKKPYLKYFHVSKTGEKFPDVEIPLNEPTMMHDIAVTENFVVIPESQMVFSLHEMVRGGSPVVYKKDKVSRFGVLNKYAKNSKHIKWIEVPDCFCFHLWNSWEEPETDEIVVIGSCMTPPDSVFNECDENLRSVLSEIRLNLKTGKSTRRLISESKSDQINLEAGMVNRSKLGRKTIFAFLAIAEPWPKVSGFAKVLETGEVNKYIYGEGKFGGEHYFLPNHPESGSEDDGYIISFVYDENARRSELLIVNAANLKLEASIKLPSRVHYGFNGTFIKAKELQSQV